MEQYELSALIMQCSLILGLGSIILRLCAEMRNDSPIEWWQLVATRGRDNRNYASSTKLWLNIGAFLMCWIAVYMVLQVDWRDRAVEVVGFLGVFALFISGVEAYSRHLKAKLGGNDADQVAPKVSGTAGT